MVKNNSQGLKLVASGQINEDEFTDETMPFRTLSFRPQVKA